MGRIAIQLDHCRPSWSAMVREFKSDESGATAIEYGLIVSLVFLAIMAAVNQVANSNVENYSTLTSAMGTTSG